MKFFKHFTDAHRGSSLEILKQKHGMAGIGRYWTLVELCAEKLSKNDDEAFAEHHCVFAFGKSALARCLEYGNHVHLMRYLSDLQVIGLCSIDADDVRIMCSMPKLLESMDRDTKRARKVRAIAAPKIKKKRKSKIVEVEETQTAQNTAPISSATKKLEIIKIKNAQELVDTFSEEFLAQLRETYGDHFVGQEIPQMALKIIATEDYKTNYQSFAQAWMRYSSKNAEREEAQMRKASSVNNVMAMVENG